MKLFIQNIFSQYVEIFANVRTCT